MSSPASIQGQLKQVSSIIPLQAQYPIYVYILCPILITYFGIYLILRNHYIFKPKIQLFLKKTQIKSLIIRQIIIDVLSSLSILTFVMGSILITSDDQAIQLIVHNDMYWAGLCMAILAYRNIKQQELLEMKVLTKNGIFLVFCYVVIVYQYFSQYSSLLMGMLLMAFYILNMLIKVYEQKFVHLIQELFGSKPMQITDNQYSHTNNMESPQYLSLNYPVSKVELGERMSGYEPRLKRLKLKTKVAVTKKLLMISLVIRLSQEKMAAKMKRNVGAYYGGLNGTTNQKVRRIQNENKKSLPEESQPKEVLSSAGYEQVVVNITQSDDQLDVLFTVFPVRLFQSSVIISVLFTLLLNLAFGICLDYVMSITSTLTYGAYLQNLYALLILPVLPNISKVEYFNTMCLSTLWKYFLIGFFVTVNVAFNGEGGIRTSNVLQIQVILLISLNLFIIGYLLAQSKSQYRIPIVFFLLFSANIGVVYYGIRQTNN